MTTQTVFPRSLKKSDHIALAHNEITTVLEVSEKENRTLIKVSAGYTLSFGIHGQVKKIVSL